MTVYETLTPEGVRTYLAAHPTLAARLGGAPAGWSVREVSDGNLNLVFLVYGTDGTVCVKQSLPHVRVDPQWRMPLDRTAFEAAWMQRVEALVPGHVPAFLSFDPDRFILVMECLTGFVTLRQAVAAGADPVGPSRVIGRVTAHTGFLTSLLARPLEEVLPDMGVFARNTTLTRITTDLVLTDPFRTHKRNHWLPGLEADVMALQGDAAVLCAVVGLQERFLTAPQALLHGDLHGGSIMVKDSDVRLIDGEFSLYGPIGFDCGLYLAYLLLARSAAPAPARRERLAEAMQAFWSAFRETFLALWRSGKAQGDLFSSGLLAVHGDLLMAEQERYLAVVQADMIGFAATEVIRRLIGYAQTSDFDWLETDEDKIVRQKEALAFAVSLLRELPLTFEGFMDRLPR